MANRTGAATRDAARAGYTRGVLVFFSNRSGCLGSLLISVIGTVILLLVLGVLD